MPGCDSGGVVCSFLLLSRGHHGRRQAENPLNPLSSFTRPPLTYNVKDPPDKKPGQPVLPDFDLEEYVARHVLATAANRLVRCGERPSRTRSRFGQTGRSIKLSTFHTPCGLSRKLRHISTRPGHYPPASSTFGCSAAGYARPASLLCPEFWHACTIMNVRLHICTTGAAE
jgi:hypothetical protein